MRKNLTEIVFILDRSGSMSGLETDTIGGFNSMIEKQKKENGEAFVLFLCDIKGNRVNDRNGFALLMSISDGLSGSAGASIPNCDQDIRVINHITVALVHAVGRVMGLNQCFLIALGCNVEIPISQGFRPFCGLTFTWDGAFKRYSRIGCFQPQHDLSGIHIYTDCHSGYKVRDAFIFDEIDDLLPESFFEVYAAFVFLIETKREVLRTMPGKSTGLHFLFHLLTMY